MVLAATLLLSACSGGDDDSEDAARRSTTTSSSTTTSTTAPSTTTTTEPTTTTTVAAISATAPPTIRAAAPTTQPSPTPPAEPCPADVAPRSAPPPLVPSDPNDVRAITLTVRNDHENPVQFEFRTLTYTLFGGASKTFENVAPKYREERITAVLVGRSEFRYMIELQPSGVYELALKRTDLQRGCGGKVFVVLERAQVSA